MNFSFGIIVFRVDPNANALKLYLGSHVVRWRQYWYLWLCSGITWSRFGCQVLHAVAVRVVESAGKCFVGRPPSCIPSFHCRWSPNIQTFPRLTAFIFLDAVRLEFKCQPFPLSVCRMKPYRFYCNFVAGSATF